jgi:hypothetical protein
LDDVQVAPQSRRDDLGQIQSIGLEPLRAGAALEGVAPVDQDRLDLSPGLVQEASGFGPLPGLEGDQALVGPGQGRALSQ